MSALIQDYEQPASITVFITVLCILTFIGSAGSLVKQSIIYFIADLQAAKFTTAKKMVDPDVNRNKRPNKDAQFVQKFITNLNVSADNIRRAALADVLSPLLCLAGALLIWKLRNKGFYPVSSGNVNRIYQPFCNFWPK